MDFSNYNLRKSFIRPGDLYFWTATIHNWIHLLEADEKKKIIIHSLQWLKQNDLAKIEGYVIMPNHLHLIWTVDQKNRKESVQGSLLKTYSPFAKILPKTI